MLSPILKKIEGWLSAPSVVVTSEPIRSADKWLVIRGDLVNCHFEQFDSEQGGGESCPLDPGCSIRGGRRYELKSNSPDLDSSSGVHDMDNDREIVSQE
jgi:hypothetical protein